MKRLRSTVAAALIIAGILIGLFPFISIWRVGGDMLGELPAIEGIDHVDKRVGPSAMFDDEFILARRTLTGAVDGQVVVEALTAGGFEPMGDGGYAKACCGGYDAVWAFIRGVDKDQVVVELTPADGDVQLSWPLFTGFGSLLALVGVGMLLTGRGGASTPTKDTPRHSVI